MNLTNPAGDTTGSATYVVYGEERATSGASIPTLRFAGEQRDATTGFYYLRARYYDPAIGRFITKDPYPGSLGVPGSLNPYAYVLDSPTNFVDPSGRCPWCRPPSLIEAVKGIGDEILGAGGDAFEFYSEQEQQRLQLEIEVATRFVTASCASFAVAGAGVAATFLTNPLVGIPAGAVAFAFAAYLDAKEGDMVGLSLNGFLRFLGSLEYGGYERGGNKALGPTLDKLAERGQRVDRWLLGLAFAKCVNSAAGG